MEETEEPEDSEGVDGAGADLQEGHDANGCKHHKFPVARPRRPARIQARNGIRHREAKTHQNSVVVFQRWVGSRNFKFGIADLVAGASETIEITNGFLLPKRGNSYHGDDCKRKERLFGVEPDRGIDE